jgi:hypothetical protein
MNKRILFGVLFLALGATCERSLKAKPEKAIPSLERSSQSVPKGESDNSIPRSLLGKRLRDEAPRAEPRVEVVKITAQPSSDSSTVHQKEPQKSRSELLENAAKLSREMQGVADTLKKSSEEKPSRRPAPTRSSDGEKTIFTEALQSRAIDITKPTTVTTASGKTKVLEPGTIYFSEPLDPSAITTKSEKKAKATMTKEKSAEAEDIGVVKKPKPTIVGDIEVPAGTKAPSADTVAGWKAEVDAKKEKATREKREVSSEERIKTERIAEENKATFSSSSQALAIRKPGDIVAVKPLDSVTGALVTTSKPLTPETGAIIPYTGKPSGPISVTADESKPGMSGKKKAALGAAAVGAGAAGVGAAALGAGLIGAGALGVAGAVGVGMSGDKDKPAPEIAPERVEDIKGLDAGSGLGESFEPSPIGG